MHTCTQLSKLVENRSVLKGCFVIFVEKLEANEGDTVTFDKVLYVDGKFGKPFVEGAKVTGVVEKQGKGKKITIVKYKAKKSSTRRKQGHRQPYTRVKIEAIEA